MAVSLDFLSSQFTKLLEEYRRTQLENEQDREHVRQLVRGFNVEFAKLDARVEVGLIELSERFDQYHADLSDRLSSIAEQLDRFHKRQDRIETLLLDIAAKLP